MNHANYQALEMFRETHQRLPLDRDDWRTVEDLAHFIQYGQPPSFQLDDGMPPATAGEDANVIQ